MRLAAALDLAASHLENLMMGRLSALLRSGGPLDAAVMKSLIRKASVLVAEAAAAGVAASIGSAALSAALYARPPKRGSASAAVGVMLRRWHREDEGSDPVAAVAAHRAAAAESRAAAVRAASRARSAAVRRRKSPKARPLAS